MKNKIFSYITNTLIIVNPYQDLKEEFTSETIEKYCKIAKSN